MDELRVGDFCRVEGSTPGRYIGHGLAIGVTVHESALRVGRATVLEPESDIERLTRLPHVSWDGVEAAAAAVRWFAAQGADRG